MSLCVCCKVIVMSLTPIKRKKKVFWVMYIHRINNTSFNSIKEEVKKLFLCNPLFTDNQFVFLSQ